MNPSGYPASTSTPALSNDVWQHQHTHTSWSHANGPVQPCGHPSPVNSGSGKSTRSHPQHMPAIEAAGADKNEAPA